VEAGLLVGRLLDSGCGTGEHTLLAASRGAEATGVDISQTAVERARAEAARRGVAADFAVVDMLGQVPFAEATFDTLLDSGVFHSFEGAEQQAYVGNLRRLLRPGGSAYVMCFSDLQPGDWGPRRITQDEIRSAFSEGWEVSTIEPSTFHVNEVEGTTRVASWLATVRRSPVP
jgi:SAM-dependent methyltransferase